jgi:glycosyltransferase involved in cell wall biosynthesis
MNVGIVVPVRNGSELLDHCLTAVVAEAAPMQARVLLVDDASTDDTAHVAEQLGAEVLRLDTPAGPYAARNRGWRSLDSDSLVFTDVRCRPRPGWLAGLLAALVDPTAAVAGGDVYADADPTSPVAARYVHRWQPLMPDRGLSHEFMPFLPTANIVTRRTVLEGVDGFRQIRSGGDLDFCWRVQLAGLGSIAYAPDAGVDWQPRATVREVLRQWFRYGAAKPALYRDYAEHGYVAEPPMSWPRLLYGDGRALLADLRRQRGREWDVEVVDRLCHLAWCYGYRREWAKLPRPDERSAGPVSDRR